ncbi:fused signal recognition particle receptor [Candidatus Planktophila limnetica]|uniref:Signal recognition particle receptor FtsY n=1 Tax=Candidatus Planktophila limnetica TaxID=573600 RepID=A0A249LEY4_9ACTN|nr:signal recognition particle-docking protein FtsY [Candidatus Planktophila limnetica]ASY27557.1 fused signal recognition particle receptor [Candidatus Planktophila limnetica]
MGIFSKFLSKIKVSDLLHKPDLDEAENELIATDLGADLARRIIEETRKVKSQTPEEALQSVLSSHLSKKPRQLLIQPGLTTVMVVGVNGTGKTTTVAKLAQKFSPQGLVVLAAADTFRAAAVEQLQTWGKRIGLEVISGKENSDPASVAFDAIEKSRNLSASFLFIDTAGRLHNKSDLMNELGKIKRVIEKVSPVSEVLLVIDATTGQNGLQQAKIFAEAVNVTGIVLTKLDGSSRGGIALAIEDGLDIPIKFVGKGESIDDLTEFDPIAYIKGLIS